MSTETIPRKARLRPPTLKVSVESFTNEPKVSAKVFEVLPNIFISGYEAAKDWEVLSSARITHVLNLAGESKCPNCFSSVLQYFSMKMPDNPKVDILFFLYFALDFILESVSGKGKVLIHCVKGTSRAAAVVLAYLMARGYSEQEAYNCLLASQPTIDPNFGFVCQLKEWGSRNSEVRRFGYSERYEMFVNTQGDNHCCIEISENKCRVVIRQCSKEEEILALACARVWERFNPGEADVLYI
jgi:hypothetical protein